MMKPLGKKKELEKLLASKKLQWLNDDVLREWKLLRWMHK